MKPYNERLPLIDEAIEYHKGKWPTKLGVQGDDREGLFFVGFKTKMMQMSHGPDTDESEHVCNQEEFEQRSKELGWINGYKWGVEYETNGEKPDLPDDVVVEFRSVGIKGIVIDGWLGFGTVADWEWSVSDKFRIIDERYKPKEQEMSNDWYEKGELPPANTECEVRIEGQWLPTVVIGHYANEAVVVDPCVTVQRFFCTTANNLRPLRTETDKLVEQAKKDFMNANVGSYTTYERKCIEALTNAGYRKIKPMSEQEFLKQCLDICGHGDVRLYRSGCRFIDQGDWL